MLERLKDPATQINLLRLYNFAVAMMVLKEWYDTPEASASEYSFDIFVHLLQASVTLASSQNKKTVNTVANSARLLSIAEHTLTGTSTIPLIANGVDVANHLLNLYKTGMTLFPFQKKVTVDPVSNDSRNVHRVVKEKTFGPG